jgi:asparagine synthase (glutamine-hydrolysing)
MRWSIESRVPFLNTKLSNLVLGFPEKFLLNENGETKSVFREAMRGIVDQSILDRKDKIGFATPQNKWITKDFLQKESVLEGSENIEFIERQLLENFLFSESQSSNEKMNTTWRVVNLIKWKEIMGVD